MLSSRIGSILWKLGKARGDIFWLKGLNLKWETENFFCHIPGRNWVLMLGAYAWCLRLVLTLGGPILALLESKLARARLRPEK